MLKFYQEIVVFMLKIHEKSAKTAFFWQNLDISRIFLSYVKLSGLYVGVFQKTLVGYKNM